jgi:hypothetical protein
VPETVTYASNGVAKFPHAVAFHGIQLFIISAVMLRRGDLTTSAQRGFMHLIVWSYTGILVFASAQTLAGRAPSELTPWSLGLLAAVGGVLFGLSRVISGLRNSAPEDRETPVPVA